MADVNDVRRASEQVERQKELLDDAVANGDVTEEECEAIRACWSRYRRNRWSKPLTQRDRLSNLRLSAERTETPLTAFSSGGDIDIALDAHEEAGAASDSAQGAHADALVAFFEFLDGEPDWPDYDWYYRYEKPERGIERKDADQMLDEAEVVEIRTHAAHPRCKAFVELMADCGTRVAATCQLRVGDLDLDAEPPTIRLNPDGESQKGAESHIMKEIDLKESKRWVRRYVRESHPEGPDPPDDAPLFALRRGYDPENRQECAASPRTMQDQIDTAAERAGISKPTNHHSFKHACVKRLRWKYGLKWEEIGDRVLWSEQSLQTMATTYGRLNEEERRKRLRERMGIVDADDGEDAEAREIECQTCGADLSPSERYCPQCGQDPREPPGTTEPMVPLSEIKGVFAGMIERAGEQAGFEIDGTALIDEMQPLPEGRVMYPADGEMAALEDAEDS